MHPHGTKKAPASPHITRPGGVRSERAPGQSEARGGGRRTEEGAVPI